VTAVFIHVAILTHRSVVLFQWAVVGVLWTFLSSSLYSILTQASKQTNKHINGHRHLVRLNSTSVRHT